jgi:hypothetical protein
MLAQSNLSATPGLQNSFSINANPRLEDGGGHDGLLFYFIFDIYF